MGLNGRYIEALDGTLEIAVHVWEKSVVIGNLGEPASLSGLATVSRLQWLAAIAAAPHDKIKPMGNAC